MELTHPEKTDSGRIAHVTVIDIFGKLTRDLVCVVDSKDYIEITLVNGSAVQKLGARVGDVVDMIYKD